MNIKMTLILLTTILATSASAQVNILPGGRGNIYIGTPMNLPSPAANIAISPRISLPAPLLTPTVALTLSPVMVAAAIPVLPVALPSAIPVMPVSLPSPHAEEHVYEVKALKMAQPLALMHSINLSAPVKDSTPAKSVAAAGEKLDGLFDGRKDEKTGTDESGPVRTDRRQSLPENDLEKEIGAY